MSSIVTTEVVWNASVEHDGSLCGHLTFDPDQYIRCVADHNKHDLRLRHLIEGMHSLPALRPTGLTHPTDPTWFSIDTYTQEVDAILRTSNMAEWVARLITLSDQTVVSNQEHGGKSSFKFVGRYKGQEFCLYDYKGGHSIHIGGDPDRLDICGLRLSLWKAVASVTTPTPFQAQCSDYHSESWGYPVVALPEAKAVTTPTPTATTL